MFKKILLFFLELTSEEIIHKTGEKASFSGLYRNGKEFIALSKGERFPPSSFSSKWILVVSV
jgi:hypothetical protein